MEQLLPQLKIECRNDPRLNQAGAAMACCMILQRQADSGGEASDGISSFKAGDIMITKKQGVSNKKDQMAWAEQARKAAMEDIRPLLKDTGFYAGQTDFFAEDKKKGRKKRGH